MKQRLIFEIEPPREPDLRKIKTQIEIFGPLVDAILVPDNHLGRYAMSSIVVAIEIQNLGFKPIVALNARDRNDVRLASDLISLRAYGIEEVLFLFGDPIPGPRSTLTVKEMLASPHAKELRRGAVATVGKPLGWRRAADFFFTQIAFNRPDVAAWKTESEIDAPVYCGVMALQSSELAQKFLENIPDLKVPENYLKKFNESSDYGFDAALEELEFLSESGADGAHLVVPAGWRRFAGMLQKWLDFNP